MAEFSQVYDSYFSRVYNYVRYRVASDAEADDVASRVFERALDRFASFDTARGSVDAWLFAIARNAVTDHFRERGAAFAPLDVLPERPAPEPRAEDVLAGDEALDRLAAALRGLDDRERELLALKFGARMTNRDIAAHAGLTESNVGVLVFRAVKKLRTVLTP